MNTRSQRSPMIRLDEAAQTAPSLAALQERVRESLHCMALVERDIPVSLRSHVKAGPIDGEHWCLLVSNTAASTKLRQLLPIFLQTLAQAGSQVSAIRIKVQAAPR